MLWIFSSMINISKNSVVKNSSMYLLSYYVYRFLNLLLVYFHIPVPKTWKLQIRESNVRAKFLAYSKTYSLKYQLFYSTVCGVFPSVWNINIDQAKVQLCVCMYFRSPVHSVCSNHEVVVIQPRTGTAMFLGYVANYAYYHRPPTPPVATVFLYLFISPLYPISPHH